MSAYAQSPELPLENGKIIYTEVVEVESKSKDDLYTSAREWFAKSYNSANNVIQMDDKESGKIVGKALMPVYHKAFGSDYDSGNIHYTISIYLKDGRYKYEVSDFYHTGTVAGVPDYGNCEKMINTEKKAYRKAFNYYLLQMDDNSKAMVHGLKESMLTKATSTGDEDW